MLQITWNTDRVIKDLEKEAKQTKYALSRTLNFVQEAKQRELGQHVVTVMNVRNAKARREFPRIVMFGRDDRSDHKVDRFEATLRILGKTEAARTPLLKRLSEIALRQDDAGPQSSSALYRGQNGELIVGGFAIPAPGLRTATREVPQALYPSALGLSSRRAIEGGFNFAGQYKGGKGKRGFRKGTKFYFVRAGHGIFVRDQRNKRFKKEGGKNPIRMPDASRGYADKGSEYEQIWFFRQRIILPKRIDLAGVYQRGLAEQFATTYVRFFDEAMATAR